MIGEFPAQRTLEMFPFDDVIMTVHYMVVIQHGSYASVWFKHIYFPQLGKCFVSNGAKIVDH